MKTHSVGTLAVVIVAFPALAHSADIKTGRALAAARCQTCHGIDGIATIPEAPNLAGENEIYLQAQLHAFRTGQRQHEIMSIVAKDLTDEEIIDLAAWYAAIRIEATPPE
ncbi:cytochrome c [Inquilinus limosus]|uniref:c-type cytochrome n=1 Tax=Inquilinus limosus TaxID=171674 RepID=UPI003F16A885